MTKQDGLDASGFLLMAEGHLRRGQGLLRKYHKTSLGYDAAYWTDQAVICTRRGLEALVQEKEET